MAGQAVPGTPFSYSDPPMTLPLPCRGAVNAPQVTSQSCIGQAKNLRLLTEFPEF